MTLDCPCQEDHEIVVTFWFLHKFDLVRFGRNYFVSTNCSCVYVAKDKICKHCKFLKTAVNCFIPKICVRRSDVSKRFHLEGIDVFMRKKFRADPILYFSKNENLVKTSTDSLDWGDSFLGKETM